MNWYERELDDLNENPCNTLYSVLIIDDYMRISMFNTTKDILDK